MVRTEAFSPLSSSNERYRRHKGKRKGRKKKSPYSFEEKSINEKDLPYNPFSMGLKMSLHKNTKEKSSLPKSKDHLKSLHKKTGLTCSGSDIPVRENIVEEVIEESGNISLENGNVDSFNFSEISNGFLLPEIQMDNTYGIYDQNGYTNHNINDNDGDDYQLMPYLGGDEKCDGPLLTYCDSLDIRNMDNPNFYIDNYIHVLNCMRRNIEREQLQGESSLSLFQDTGAFSEMKQMSREEVNFLLKWSLEMINRGNQKDREKTSECTFSYSKENVYEYREYRNESNEGNPQYSQNPPILDNESWSIPSIEDIESLCNEDYNNNNNSNDWSILDESIIHLSESLNSNQKEKYKDKENVSEGRSNGGSQPIIEEVNSEDIDDNDDNEEGVYNRPVDDLLKGKRKRTIIKSKSVMTALSWTNRKNKKKTKKTKKTKRKVYRKHEEESYWGSDHSLKQSKISMFFSYTVTEEEK